MKKDSENLSILEIGKIIKKINDKRIDYKDDLEYFTIETEDGTNFIPKMKFVGGIKIEEYLQNFLSKLDNTKNS